jgi:LacI family transcriptional regulator
VRTRARLAAARRHGSAVTIRDVAAEAGVSTATVSRALNRSGVVHAETWRKVVDAANVLRYTPHAIARSLSTRKTQTLGVVLPDLHGEFFSELIRGIDRAARQSGYHLLLSGAHSDREEMRAVLSAMRGRVDGLIVMAPDFEASSLVAESDTPIVFINSAGKTGVAVDNYSGARAMTFHLAKLGHRRIAFIKGPRANFDARERLRGHRDALKALHIPRHEELEIEGDFDEQSGIAATKKIVAMSERPTAIFSANDQMAVGALIALRETGLTVPGDMALAGFDDIPLARYVTPPLTTVGVAIEELGRRAFLQLARAIEGQPEGKREKLPTTLVVRQSCGVRVQDSTNIDAVKKSRRRAHVTQS